MLGTAVLQLAKGSTQVLLYSWTNCIVWNIAIKEETQVARCKPRIRFARKGAMIARINCKY
jgi:hypothetical protein